MAMEWERDNANETRPQGATQLLLRLLPPEVSLASLLSPSVIYMSLCYYTLYRVASFTVSIVTAVFGVTAVTSVTAVNSVSAVSSVSAVTSVSYITTVSSVTAVSAVSSVSAVASVSAVSSGTAVTRA